MRQTILWVVAALLLSACGGPKTPQEVTTAFWQAMVAGDQQAVVHYSSLETPASVDGYGRDWQGMSVEQGKVVIDGASASVATSLVGADGKQVKFVTYLLAQQGQWRVDYPLTGESVRAATGLQRLFDQFGQLSGELGTQLLDASQRLEASLQGLSRQFAELAAQLDTRLQGGVGLHADALRYHLQDLASSIERAMNEMADRLSPPDRRQMEQAVEELHEAGRKLEQRPGLETMAAGSQQAAETVQSLGTLDEAVLARYWQQWQQWLDRIDVDMQKALVALKRQG